MSGARGRGRAGAPWVACALALTALLWPGVALAHHILGIPHYKYDESYPQVPFVEVMARIGEWDLNFTCYPGTPRPGERVRFKLYVHNRKTGEAFREPVTVSFVRKRALGSDVVVAGPTVVRTGAGPEHNDYKFFHVFDDAEAYEVRVGVDLPNDLPPEEVPFPVTIGETDDRVLLGAVIGIIALTAIFVGVLKRRRKRALAATGSKVPGAREARA